jgi:hypothetical protein
MDLKHGLKEDAWNEVMEIDMDDLHEVRTLLEDDENLFPGSGREYELLDSVAED